MTTTTFANTTTNTAPPVSTGPENPTTATGSTSSGFPAGSRAARMAIPRAIDVLKDLAREHGVCVRPITLRRTDLDTGISEIIDLPCGAVREDKCGPCAKRNQHYRRVQIREGWHRTDEPLSDPEPATERQRALILARAQLEFERAAILRGIEQPDVDKDAAAALRQQRIAVIDEAVRELDDEITAEGLRGRIAPPRQGEDADGPAGPAVAVNDTGPTKSRSTRRRQDVPSLPRHKVDSRTVGRVIVGRDGSQHQDSMWLTLTLDTYGRVLPDGTPVHPDRYDYRRAAWDAVHFPRLLDRFWQNLRRCEGWSVQYAGCVEPQRRLAPHAHFAIRGTIARTTLRTVAAATYHQVWWPTAETLVYRLDRPPVWDDTQQVWADPDNGRPLQTWGQALDAIDANPNASPAHVIRFGPQVDAQGVKPGSLDAERTIRYITKYITKHAADCHTLDTDRQEAHRARLWYELQRTPCSDRCSIWLLYGIQPRKAHAKLQPGRCKAKVHQRETLGIGGRRILVSRNWSGKTLADHRHDAHAWVKNLLGVTTDTEPAAPCDGQPPTPPTVTAPTAYVWEIARPDDPDVPPIQHRLMRAITERIRHKRELAAAQDAALARDANVSATRPDGPGREVSDGLDRDDEPS